MNRWTISVIIIVIALAAAVYVLVRPSADVPATTATSTTQSALHVTTATVSASTSLYTIDVQYPQFGMPAIDAQIKKAVDDSVAEIKGYPANPPEMASPQNELTIRYDTPYIGPDFVSVRLLISEYTGGAHPNTLFSGMNFDRASGKQLLQSDAFDLIGKSAAQVSAGATAQLKATLGNEFQFAEGADSNPENFSSFLINANSVTFIFQPYQVAAYAAGPQQAVFTRIK